MRSHTVPRKLLDQFAYDDPVTKSRRLWRYGKGQPPDPRASPKTATRWAGHFAHPENALKEKELEDRLEREFEAPVNDFIEMIGYRTFYLDARRIYLLTGYVRMLFSRSFSRKAASAIHAKTKVDAFRALLKDDKMLTALTAKYTMEAIRLGLPVTEMVTKEQIIAITKKQIATHSGPEEAQRDYIQAIETMLAFPDETMLNGHWGILTTDPAHPFVIGDAPVVTFERTERNTLYWGQGFARPNVEVVLPVSPSACFHILPRVERTREPRQPHPTEVNMGQAAYAAKYCYGNINGPEIDATLQPEFGKMKMGVTGFNTHHIDAGQVLFNILMGRHPKAT
jgi:Protein of unknown function (DUF4238)